MPIANLVSTSQPQPPAATQSSIPPTAVTPSTVTTPPSAVTQPQPASINQPKPSQDREVNLDQSGGQNLPQLSSVSVPLPAGNAATDVTSVNSPALETRPQLPSPSTSQMVPPPRLPTAVKSFSTLSAPPRPPSVVLRPPAVRLNNVTSSAVRLVTPPAVTVRHSLGSDEHQEALNFLDDLHANNSRSEPSHSYIEEQNIHPPPQPISVHHGQPIRTLGARRLQGPPAFRGGMYRSPQRFPAPNFAYNDHQHRLPRKRPFPQYNYGHDGYY